MYSINIERDRRTKRQTDRQTTTWREKVNNWLFQPVSRTEWRREEKSGAQTCRKQVQRPCYQRDSTCQDPAGNWIRRRPPDYRKETQTAVVWSCLPFIRSSQNHLARHGERGKKTRQTEKKVRRQHQGMERPGVRQVPDGSGEQRKMEETGCEVICGAPTTLAVKG